MSSSNGDAWHRTNTMHRCSQCTRPIGYRDRYWGTAMKPDHILCAPCAIDKLAKVAA